MIEPRLPMTTIMVLWAKRTMDEIHFAVDSIALSLSLSISISHSLPPHTHTHTRTHITVSRTHQHEVHAHLLNLLLRWESHSPVTSGAGVWERQEP